MRGLVNYNPSHYISPFTKALFLIPEAIIHFVKSRASGEIFFRINNLLKSVFPHSFEAIHLWRQVG